MVWSDTSRLSRLHSPAVIAQPLGGADRCTIPGFLFAAHIVYVLFSGVDLAAAAIHKGRRLRLACAFAAAQSPCPKLSSPTQCPAREPNTDGHFRQYSSAYPSRCCGAQSNRASRSRLGVGEGARLVGATHAGQTGGRRSALDPQSGSDTFAGGAHMKS